MKVEEIRNIAINSSQVYYDYLKSKNKGIKEISIIKISHIDNDNFIIKLSLSSKIFDVEVIFIKNISKNTTYDINDIKIIEYDKDKNILIIKPSEEIFSELIKADISDIILIYDMSFLIQRVEKWYKINGSNLSLPTNVSPLCSKYNEIPFFRDKKFQPSANQKESIKNIFTNPFSYVWGAPGTGKTQFVLAYSVMHYIKHDKKIAILAPTNNSIEQVLRGVVRMTDKAGIDRNSIIRLGTPSSKFAEEYPQICEEKGLQEKIKDINNQINILERIANYKTTISNINSIENNISSIDKIYQIKLTIDQNKTIYNNQLNEIKDNTKATKNANTELHALKYNKTKLTSQINSLKNKLKKLLNIKSTISITDIHIIESKIENKIKEINILECKYSELYSSLSELKNKDEKYSHAFNKQLALFKSCISGFQEIEQIIIDINTENIHQKKIEILKALEIKKNQIQIDSILITEYKDTTQKQILNKITKLTEVKNKISKSTTDERLKTTNVIACTLDGYIGRFSESKMNVSHIFLDEAGYANTIKALTLFNQNVPISFLGDHMQLPPVCEINDELIKQDSNYTNIFLWSLSSIYLETIFTKNIKDILLQYQKITPYKYEILTRTSLNSTYRFGEKLANILENHVYNNGFKSSDQNQGTKILFINARKNHEEIKKRISKNEVETIEKLIIKLKKNNEHNFVILSPYKNQIKLLNESMPDERNELKILTVHGSQGREWDTTILSVVDTSDKWFVDSKCVASKGLNLINTAVSRTKKRLIIVCDKQYWINQDGQFITDLLKNGEEIFI